LAVASGGGHWTQLLRLRPAFEGLNVEYVTTNPDYRAEVEGKLHVVQDANMWDKLKLFRMFLQVAGIVLSVRPDFVISTGAAPGFAALLFGRIVGAKTVWIDSVANSEQLSSSGSKVGPFANVWLTQWRHLQREGGPSHKGSVL